MIRFRLRPVARAALAAALSALAVAGHAQAAPDPELAGEVLVKLRTGAALGPLLARHPLTLAARSGARPIYRLKVVGTAETKRVIEALRLEPEVLIAESNRVHRAPEARKNGAWAIGTESAYRVQWAPQAIRLAEAQRRTLGQGVRVAVLDTGVDLQHPALASHLDPGFDFVDGDHDPSEAGSRANVAFGHGTHVAGLVALAAPAARIVPLRVLDADGNGNAWTLLEAMLHAVDPDGDPSTDDGAHVINLSLGSTARTEVLDTIAKLASCTAFERGDGEAAEDVSDAGYNDDRTRCARSTGAVVVAAAGNEASDEPHYPAAEGAYGLLAVAASNAARRLASFSSFGSWVHLAAPGDGLTSTVPGGGFGTWSGTSMAAPLVSGVAALGRAAAPAMSANDVARRIERNTAALCGTPLGQLDAATVVLGWSPSRRTCR
ncbi:MAG TPA: S8 family serine peptidase [Albitalea sp.]